MYPQIFYYQIVQSHLLSPQVTKLVLQPVAAAIVFEAGQYIKVIHEDNSESPLSIASAPCANADIELHLSHPPKNQKALEILSHSQAGIPLKLSGAYGTCTQSRLIADRPIIFYVRGTGFAPVKALLEKLVQNPQAQPIHLFWGVASLEDFYLQDLIQSWKRTFIDFRYTPIISRTVDQHKLRDAVISHYPDLSDQQMYASGPPAMVYSALTDFQQHGLDKEFFYSDVLDYATSR